MISFNVYEECPTYIINIYVGGNIDQAKELCREYCYREGYYGGLCVTVEPISYIYTGGEEDGVRIGLINYPRFPTNSEELFKTAKDLTFLLIDRLHQHSATIVTPEKSYFYSRREK